jgi:outer membrane protein assembly factor BamB
MESSAIIYRHYLYVSDNGGNLICLDLETLEPVWVQDTLDDTNCTPVLDIEEDGKAYIYTSTSFHANWRASEYETVDIPIWKIDAETGTIVWSVSYDCWTIPDVSGGVQGTLASGRDVLKDYIYVPVSRTPDEMTGKLVAINKRTGEVAWEYDSAYSWSSPVCVYDQNGNGYVVIGDYDGKLSLLNGVTGELLDSIGLGSNIEASPAVYENRLVVGTRGMLIYGISFR